MRNLTPGKSDRGGRDDLKSAGLPEKTRKSIAQRLSAHRRFVPPLSAQPSCQKYPRKRLGLTFPTVSLGISQRRPAMIVCHCQHITDRDITAAIDWMRASDRFALITPGKIYRALGKRADCGSCMPLFLATMQGNANLAVPVDPQAVPAELRNLRIK